MYMQKKPTKMLKNSSPVARRAWKILRLAFLWARNGGLFRNRPVVSLSAAFEKLIRKLIISDDRGGGGGALVFGDHEFSFQETPTIHVKMHRPNPSLRFKIPHILPCIKPHNVVDFDCDEDLKICEDESDTTSTSSSEGEYDEAIDAKAQRFIDEFYQQMKLQSDILSIEG